jgi:TRAP-type C4-dicarboxylate transport system permease small subunit
MTAGGGSSGRSGPFRAVRALDDAVFAVERTVVATFLIAMTVMVFLDVIYRQLSSPESKLGGFVAALTGVEDPASRQVIDTYVAPVFGAALGVAVLWFAFWTAERHSGRRLMPVRHAPLVLAVVLAAALALLGWLMVHPNIESTHFYLLLYTLCLGAALLHWTRRRPRGWRVRALMLLLVVTPLFVYAALHYFPRGYSWSKEMSLILLLWVGFFGASICAHEGKHLRMEAFDRLVPPRLMPWVRAGGFLCTAAVCGFLAVLGYEYVFDPVAGAMALGGRFEQTGIPDWLATVCVPVAFAITSLRFAGATVSVLLGGDYGMPRPTEAVSREPRSEAKETA